MMHPQTKVVDIGEPVGLGVVATARIPAGTLVWVRDPLDRLLTEEALERLAPPVRAMVVPLVFLEGGRWVLTWDHGRYTNHSCDPNCAGLGGEFDVAIRTIERGEQITNEYATIGVNVAFACQCGAPACRGQVRLGDRPVDLPGLRRRFEAALALVGRVDQPLWPLLEGRRAAGFDRLRRARRAAFGNGRLPGASPDAQPPR